MSTHEPMHGVLLVGHGTASEIGTRQFLGLAGQLQAMVSPMQVEPAFLELQQPDIADGVRRLLERGVTHAIVAPLLLFAAGHAKHDIPTAVAAALVGTQPQPVIQAEHLGCHPAIVELSQLRFLEALAKCSPVSAAETALILVGRGSRDESATAEMHEFARLRNEPDKAGELFVSFLAMAQPSLAETLAEVACRGFRRVVVQPHLLFQGELADTVQRAVAGKQAQHPQQQWLLAPLLADPQDSPPDGNQHLLRAVIDRVEAAIRVVASRQYD